MRVAQRFIAGIQSIARERSPVGTAETHVTSVVPTGLEYGMTHKFPALKVLGYCQMPLRGKQLSGIGNRTTPGGYKSEGSEHAWNGRAFSILTAGGGGLTRIYRGERGDHREAVVMTM